MATPEHEGLAAEARALRDDIADLTGAVQTLARAKAASDTAARRTRQMVLGVVVSLIIDAVLTAFLFVNSLQIHRLADCQAAYNEFNNVRTRIVTDVGATEREAERRRGDALDATFLDPSLLKPANQRTPAEAARVQQLYVEYRAAAQALQVERAAADQARAENPVPPPPSEVCGDPPDPLPS